MARELRPKRTAIPVTLKRNVCERQANRCAGAGCDEIVSARTHSGTQFDHNPALRLRDVNRAGTDYAPHQLSAFHIDALCRRCHAKKTHGTGATTAGTDAGKIKKERKRAKAIAALTDSPTKPRSKWPRGRKLSGGRKFRRTTNH